MKQLNLPRILLVTAWAAATCAAAYAQTAVRGPATLPTAKPALQAAPPATITVSGASNNLIARAQTTLVANNEIGTYGAPVFLKAKLATSSAGQSLYNLNIAFKVDGIHVGTGTTDASGNAQFQFISLPGGGYVFGSHKIEALFAGNGALAQSSTEATLGVIEAATKMEGTDGGLTLEGPGSSERHVYAEGTLVRIPGGAPVDGRVIDVTVDGVVVGNTATSKSGYFYYKGLFTKNSGKHTVQASFASDTHHAATASQKKDFEISLPVVTQAFVSIPTVQPAMPLYFVGQNITVSTKVSALPGGYGPGMPGVKVRIDRHDEPVVEVVSNAAGIASATVKLTKAGSRQIWVKVRDDKYLEGNKDPLGVYLKVNVLHSPLNVKVEGPASGKVGDMVDLKIGLTNAAHADDPLNDVFHLTVVNTPVSKGTTKIAIPSSLGIGNKAIKVVFAGDKNYAPSEGIWNINIQAKDN